MTIQTTKDGLPGLGSLPASLQLVRVEPDRFVAEAATTLAQLVRACAGRRPGPVSLSLSGGATPLPVYEALFAPGSFFLPELSLTLVDERAVAPEHPDSNYGQISRRLPPALRSRLTPMIDSTAALADLDGCARAYARQLPALDVVVLGVGADGHTASLFPGSWGLHAQDPVIPVPAPSVSPQVSRLTLTRAALATARHLVVLVAGAAKAPALTRALSAGPIDEVPARLARSDRAVWIVDTLAAPES